MKSNKDIGKKAVLLLAIAVCVSPWINAPLALLLGMLLVGLKLVPEGINLSSLASVSLKTSIVLLGFGLNLRQVVEVSNYAFLLSAVFILITLLLGYIFYSIIKIEKATSLLLSVGTAICGGSAIAAIGPIIDANQKQLSVSLAGVFVLNAVALFLFPFLGTWLGLSELQFGYWAAIAIHDTSSVVGAAETYGDESLHIATTIKLTRALWIVPVSLAFSLFYKTPGRNKMVIPWFIFLFVIAMFAKYFFPAGEALFTVFNEIGKKGMMISLLIIGAGFSISEIKKIGKKAMFFGIILWGVISTISLITILLLIE